MNFSNEREQKTLIYMIIIFDVFLILFSLLCLFAVGKSVAKYVSSGLASDTTTVACFTPSLYSDNNIKLTGISKPGDSALTDIHIRNYTNDSVSDVSIKYNIIIRTTGNVPLTFSVCDEQDNNLIDFYCDGDSGERMYTYNSPSHFAPGVSQEHVYKVKAIWNADKNDAKFACRVDAIYVSVQWIQID